jgi:hypothetical protein
MRHGKASHGNAGKDGRQRKARHGMAEPSAAGMARRGGAEHGATRPGNAGMA